MLLFVDGYDRRFDPRNPGWGRSDLTVMPGSTVRRSCRFYVVWSQQQAQAEFWQTCCRCRHLTMEVAMPCIRCGKITAKLCTCSINQAKEAFSTWSEVEIEQAIDMLREILQAKRSSGRRTN